MMRSVSSQIWRRFGTGAAGPVPSSASCSRRSQTATRRFSHSPMMPRTFDFRGLIYLKLGQLDFAIQDYNSALRIEPKMASALFGRGLARIKKGDTAGGNADVEAAKKLETKVADDFSSYGVR